MGMPEIPKGKRPTLNETKIVLLESIAAQELALAHIMNAQGEKICEITAKGHEGKVSWCEMNRSLECVNETLLSVIMQEWLLVTKLRTVLNISCDSCEEKSECIVTTTYTCPKGSVPEILIPNKKDC